VSFRPGTGFTGILEDRSIEPRQKASSRPTLNSPIPMMTPGHLPWVLKMVLLAVTAVVALIGAVLLAVPSTESVRLCLYAGKCLGF
jgi:hypothetical protein